MKLYSAYFFDLYGTLADIRTDESKPALWKRMCAYFRENGAEYAPEELWKAYEDLCRDLEKKMRSGVSPEEPSVHVEIGIGRVFDGLYDAKGVRASSKKITETAEAFRTFSTIHLRTYGGARELLHAVRAHGAKTVLLSNAQALFTVPELRKLGLTDVFDRIFLSSEYGRKKPDPAFFRAALRETGMNAGECLMIGNDPFSDVQGASGIGMDSILIRSALSPKPCPETSPEILRLNGMDLQKLRRMLFS